jgi:F0F1-type ATP synthase assembly protein I
MTGMITLHQYIIQAVTEVSAAIVAGIILGKTLGYLKVKIRRRYLNG